MRKSLVLAAAALALVACEAETATPVDNSRQPATATRTPELATPDWSAPIDTQVESRLSSAARAELAKSPIPLLVPSSEALVASAIVSTGPVWAAVSASADGVTVALHGSILAYRYSDIAPVAGDRVLRSKQGFVTVESNIWQASWHEAGVAYSLHVECAAAGDGRCADDKFLIGVVESLAHVGGRGGAP